MGFVSRLLARFCCREERRIRCPHEPLMPSDGGSADCSCRQAHTLSPPLPRRFVPKSTDRRLDSARDMNLVLGIITLSWEETQLSSTRRFSGSVAAAADEQRAAAMPWLA